jgi:heptosyltransferase-2
VSLACLFGPLELSSAAGMNIGIFLPNWVGDSVMAIPTLRALREHFGAEANLVGILRPYLSPVLDGTPWLNDRLYYDRGRCTPEHRMSRVLGELRQRRFEKLLLLTNSLSTAALAWMSGAPQRIGYDRYSRGCLLTDRIQPPHNGSEFTPVSAVDYYLRLAQLLGCTQTSQRLEMATTAAEESAADQVWNRLGLPTARQVVSFNTGGAYGVAKHWPVESFVSLARQIVATWDVSVLVLCGPSDRQIAQSIVTQTDHPRVVSLANEPISLGLTKACVRRSSLMVSTDSGPRHFAAAFNVPTVTLFGPTDPRWSVNYNPREISLRLNLSCSPCAKRVCPLGHHECMRKLAVTDVFAAVARMMEPGVRSDAA